MRGSAVLPNLYTLIYGGNVETKLAMARRLFSRYGREIERDQQISPGIAALLRLRQGLSRQMLTMGLDVICCRCAQKTGGGCCSEAIAAETDVAQLLLNMLAGVLVACRQHDGVSCPYLGENGCIFLFKPVFCLNYICPDIAGRSQDAELGILERLTGGLLQAQTGIESLLLDFFAGRAPELGEEGLISRLCSGTLP